MDLIFFFLILVLMKLMIRGIHSGFEVDWWSGVLDRFKIGFCVHIGF